MSLENSRYKITKNENKLMLTDKKTLKSRILDVDDIDYVIDDNQKLRDSNIIENYFKLKEEPYEPKMMTKTADYVKEYKEAEKLYSNIKYEDIIDNFVKKHNLTEFEIDALASVPDLSSIRGFSRTEEDKKTILNDFKNLQKALTEDKKIPTDVFTYLKAYFKNYAIAHKLLLEYDPNETVYDFINNKNFYKNNVQYEVIKSKTDEDIKSLKDLYDMEIKTLYNINLDYLNNLLNKFNLILQKLDEEKKRVIIYKNFNKNSDLIDNINISPSYNTIIKKESKGIAGEATTIPESDINYFYDLFDAIPNKDKQKIVFDILSNADNDKKSKAANEDIISTIDIYLKEEGVISDDDDVEKYLSEIVDKGQSSPTLIRKVLDKIKKEKSEYKGITTAYYLDKYKEIVKKQNNDDVLKNYDDLNANDKNILLSKLKKYNNFRDLTKFKEDTKKSAISENAKKFINTLTNKTKHILYRKYVLESLKEKEKKEEVEILPIPEVISVPPKESKETIEGEEIKEEDEEKKKKLEEEKKKLIEERDQLLESYEEKIKDKKGEKKDIKKKIKDIDLEIEEIENKYNPSMEKLNLLNPFVKALEENIFYLASIHNPLLNQLFDLIKPSQAIAEAGYKYNDFYSFCSKISEKGLSYFENPYLIKLLIYIYNSAKNKDDLFKIHADWYDNKGKAIDFNFNKPRTFISGKTDTPSDASLLSKTTPKKILEDILKTKFKESDLTNTFGELIISQNKDFAKLFITDLLPIIEKGISSKGDGYLKGNTIKSNLTGYGWTDDTLVRIESINKILKEYKKAKGRMDPHLRNIIKYHPGNGRLALGTDGYAYGWTDDTLTRIERITDSLKMYSNGKLIGNGFIKKKSWTKPMYQQSAEGWTDDTLKRIEKISYTLDDY